MKVLVTGAAGFIGAQLGKQLLERGESVVGIDNLNNYYDVNLKLWRLEKLKKHSNFIFYKISRAAFCLNNRNLHRIIRSGSLP